MAGKDEKAAARTARLAKALRDNLARRKAQQRARLSEGHRSEAEGDRSPDAKKPQEPEA